MTKSYHNCSTWLLIALVFWLLLCPLSAVSKDASTDFEAVIPLAELSNAIYLERSEFEKIVTQNKLALKQFHNIKGIEVTYALLSDDDKKQFIVVIRGTSNIENAMVDMDIKLLPDPITQQKLHSGFAAAANAIQSEINKIIQPTKYKITTTGHSLGGAVALALAMQLDKNGHDIQRVVTFGQPKVTNIAGAKAYQHLDIIRFVRPKDIVPLVPPVDPLELKNLDIYWHAGQEFILLGNNEFAVIEGANAMLRAAEFFMETPGQHNVQNHSMTSYLDLIKQNAKTNNLVEYKSSFNPFGLFSGN